MVSGDNFSHLCRVCKKDFAEEARYETWSIAHNSNLFFCQALLCVGAGLHYVPSTCTVLVLLGSRETLFSALNLKGLYCEANDPIAKPKCKSNQKMPIASFASLPWPCAIKDITQELWKVHWWEDENTTKCKPPKTKALRRRILLQSLTLLIG